MKWYVYAICFVLIFAGVFCGMRLHTLMSAESYVNGSIDITNQFSVTSFYYDSSKDGAVVLYNDIYNNPENYSYEQNLLPVDDFNGVKNTYQIVYNGYTLVDTQISAGSVFAVILLDFYDTNGDVICSAFLNISIKFLSNKTTITFSTTGSQNASFLTQYFNDYGIRLKINEIKGIN